MVDGRREAPRDVDNGPVKHSEGLEVVVDAHDRHDDGFHHGCFGGASRCDASDGAHGCGGGGDNGGGFSVLRFEIEAFTVRLRGG